MENHIRTFIAIQTYPGNQLLEIFGDVKEILKNEQIKWVSENNLHITLMFLGETSEILVRKVSGKLESVARKYHEFYFGLKGIGYFKTGGQPRVLFAGTENTALLKELAADVEKEIASLGFQKSGKKFSPHLTLGRIKYLSDHKKLQELECRYHETVIQEVKVSNITFYQSILKPQGAVYQPVKIIKLQP